MNIGEAMRIGRKNAAYTQKELAALLHTSAQNISLYEKGLRTPKIELLNSLSNICFNSFPTPDVRLAYVEIRNYISEKMQEETTEEINSLLEKINDDRTAELLQSFNLLNPTGQYTAIERVTELTEIKRYTIK